MTVQRYGEAHVLVDLPSLTAVHAVYRAILSADLPGVVQVVPAAMSVLVEFSPRVTTGAALIAALERVDPQAAVALAGQTVTVVTSYDGADLAAVAELFGFTRPEFIAWHVAQDWTVAFTGFAPGFAYLCADAPFASVPRLASPRTQVPAGSVAMAGEYTGIYPRSSPGGWHIIGHTDVELWNIHRDPPALMKPGMVVEFTER